MYTPTPNNGKMDMVITGADDFWDFCNHLTEIARNERVVDRIVWRTSTGELYSGASYDFDEEGLEYLSVGFITNNVLVMAEIEDGTYGELQALRVYSGRSFNEKMREATEKETEDYLLGRRVFPGSIESEHGLLIYDEGE